MKVIALATHSAVIKDAAKRKRYAQKRSYSDSLLGGDRLMFSVITGKVLTNRVGRFSTTFRYGLWISRSERRTPSEALIRTQ
jgi:hypothetical protein